MSASLTPRRSRVRSLLRPRTLVPVAVIVVIAAAGITVNLVADQKADLRAGVSSGFPAPRLDFRLTTGPARALVGGRPAYPWYGDSVNIGQWPGYVAMFAPIAGLPDGILDVGSALLAALLVAISLVAWARAGGAPPRPWLAAVLLSMPALFLVRVDQLNAAIGLATLSLAIWAQRRDRMVLAGAALAVGLGRVSNALPVAAMLLVVASTDRRAIARMALGAAVVVVPLALVAFAWDANWLADYARNLAVYPISGPLFVVRSVGGGAGVLVFNAAVVAAAAALAWPARGRPVDLDRAALCLALGVLVTTTAVYYPAVFALPAIIRVARRPGLEGAAWIAGIAPWCVYLAAAPALLRGEDQPALNVLTLLFPLSAFPLLRAARDLPTLTEARRA